MHASLKMQIAFSIARKQPSSQTPPEKSSRSYQNYRAALGRNNINPLFPHILSIVFARHPQLPTRPTGTLTPASLPYAAGTSVSRQVQVLVLAGSYTDRAGNEGLGVGTAVQLLPGNMVGKLVASATATPLSGIAGGAAAASAASSSAAALAGGTCLALAA
jgi:hypothetical protein